MMECLGTLLAFTAKFYKSGKRNEHRFRGFILTLVVASFWCYYFVRIHLWWLAFYNVVGVGMAIRGALNNRRKA